MDCTIRRAVREDLPEILALVNHAYEREYWLIPGPRLKSLEDVRAEFESQWNAFLVAEGDRRIYGVVRITHPNPGLHTPGPYIGLLAVEPSGQGHGIGRALMSAAEQTLLESGDSEAYLECLGDMGMPERYARMGYVPVSSSLNTRWNSTRPFTLVLMRKALLESIEENP